MYPIIERLASERGIAPDDVNYIFSGIFDHLVSIVPELKQVIEDVFENAGEEDLKVHINKMIILLQRQDLDIFKTWSMPQPIGSIKQPGCDTIL